MEKEDPAGPDGASGPDPAHHQVKTAAATTAPNTKEIDAPWPRCIGELTMGDVYDLASTAANPREIS